MTRQGDNLRREYDLLRYREKTRFDILYGLKLGSYEAGVVDQVTVNSFPKIDKDSDDYLNQLTDIVRKLTTFARKDPTVLKVAIDIIQEDERHDKAEIQRAKTDQVEIPGRPKHWKSRCWEGFKQTLSNRISQIPKDSGETPDNWLSLHLARVRWEIISDLLDIKLLCVPPLIPVEWDIFQDSVVCYHECITKYLEDIVSRDVNINEMIQLLVWANEYTGSALLRDPQLRIKDSELLGVPLSYQTLSNLRRRYLDEVGGSLGEWLPNNLKEDMTDWSSDKEPHRDGENYYYTTYPVNAFKIIFENLTVASRLSDDVKIQLLAICLKELNQNLQKYTDGVIEYIKKFSSPPKKKLSVTIKSTTLPQPPSYHVQHSVALLNNFCLIDRNLNELKDKFDVSDIDNEKQLSNLKTVLHDQSLKCSHIFVSTLKSAIKPHEAEMLTELWFKSDNTLITRICEIITDYTLGLRTHYFKTCILEIETFAQQLHMKAMMGKRLICKDEVERKAVVHKIGQETETLLNMFTTLKLSSADEDKAHSGWGVVSELTDVIDVEKTTVKLQITILVNTYPDIKKKQLSRILRLRGDFANKLAKRAFIADALIKPDSNNVRETVFSTIKI